MKPEFMRLRRSLAIAFATLLAATGLIVLSPAGAAQAHHNTLGVSAACVDSTWTITWTITNSETDKAETITTSSDTALVAVGTEIGAGATFTKTETVSEPIEKTLTVQGYWPSSGVTDVPRSISISPYDFKGECVSYPPVEPETPVEPQPPVTPQISVTATPCVYDGTTSTSDITVTVSGLPVGALYTIRVYNGAAEVNTAFGTVGAGATTATFPGLEPGDYHAQVESYGTTTAQSSTLTTTSCTPSNPPVDEVPEPLPPVSTPRLVITPLDCSNNVTTPTVSVSVAGLIATEEYQVLLLNEGGEPVATRALTGVTSDEVVFSNLAAPASYAAVLQVEDGETVAETVDLADVAPCLAGGGVLPPKQQVLGSSVVAPTAVLPAQTLAVTGPSEVSSLAAFAALLLTAGGALVTARLRSRVGA